ncbi:hypothetical protein [Chitinophaga niastensis]|nr:hypothetical protein [Chitinophaga niastensis]
MARMGSSFSYTGTIGICCFYKLGGKYYLRKKSSLSGRRVKKEGTGKQ